MTTIVIDFKNKKVVADKQTTSSKVEYSFMKQDYQVLDYTFLPTITSKIHSLTLEGQSIIFTAAGDCAEINRQLTRVKKTGFIDKSKGDCTIALIYNKGDGLLVDLYKAIKTWRGYKWDKTIEQGDTNIIIFGSGGNYAYGAFMGGLSAEEAIIAASKCDIYTSSEYDVVEL